MGVAALTRRAGWLALLLACCTFKPTGVSGLHFACQEDSDCAVGWRCTAGECQRPGDGTGGGGEVDAGADAGGGTPDAGPNPPVALSLSAPVSPVAAGRCALLDLELLDAQGAPALAAADLEVTVQAAPAQLQLYADVQCSQPAGVLTVLKNTQGRPFYAKTPTGLDYQVSATASGLTGASTPLSVTPVVRAFDCGFDAGDDEADCPVGPPVRTLKDAFLVGQALPRGNVAGIDEARCELVAVDRVHCDRGVSGQPLLLRLQVAELDSAVVQHVAAQCDGGAEVPLLSAVDPASTLLFSSQSNGGTVVDSNDFVVADLDAGTSVVYDFGGCPGNAPAAVATQVVSLPGLQVSRGRTLLAVDAGLATLPAPDAGLVLMQPRLRSSAVGVCDRSVRAELDLAAAAVDFTRGNGAAGGCYGVAVGLRAERVELGPVGQAQQAGAAFAPGESTQAVTLPSPVDVTRTLVFSATEGAFGQASGETDWPGAVGADAWPGEAVATFALDAGLVFSTEVDVRRGASDGGARFTFFTVELNP